MTLKEKKNITNFILQLTTHEITPHEIPPHKNPKL